MSNKNGNVLIKVKGISKSYNGKLVIDNFSLDIYQDEFFVIIGSGGSGKTVLLKMLTGIVPCDRGEVLINNLSLEKSMIDYNIGMLFQKNALFDSITVKENLAFPLREKGLSDLDEIDLKIERYLAEVDLTGSEEKYPSELSGGMQKRLGIARALIVEPKIFFCDDPAAGLDPITGKKIFNLIYRLKKEFKYTLIMVTSIMQPIKEHADRVMLLTEKSVLIEDINRGPELSVDVTDFIKGR